MKLGFDFGSTNTILSTYDPVNDQLKAVTMGANSHIPSVVTVRQNKGRMSYGASALAQTGQPGYMSYRAFKMLLVENDPEILKKWGYSQEYTPKKIASVFLEHCLKTARTSAGEEEIQQLTICIPENWKQDFRHVDNSYVLRDICESFPFVKKLQIISEPVAASALFAYNYQKQKETPFQGHILLIDYGGGTLDITLTEIRCDAAGKMEIKVVCRTGAGENTEIPAGAGAGAYIGKAGIAYMDHIIRSVLERSGTAADNANDLSRARDILDQIFRDNVDTVRCIFDEIGTDDLDSLEEEPFEAFSYGGRLYDITYADLIRSYDAVIRPVLQENIEYILQEMELRHISPRNIGQENFKVACVGGFGSYYLVRSQVNELLGISARNPADTAIIRTQADREYAVSYGAALISAGVVGIRSVAPYAIGVALKNDGKYCANLAFSAGEDIRYDVPYYQCNKNGKIIICLPNGSIRDLLICFKRDKSDIQKITFKDSFLSRLRGIVPEHYNYANIGFSLDSNETLSIHINGCEIDGSDCSESRSIRLSRYGEMVEPYKADAHFIEQVDL